METFRFYFDKLSSVFGRIVLIIFWLLIGIGTLYKMANP